jgi:hypothetical protein
LSGVAAVALAAGAALAGPQTTPLGYAWGTNPAGGGPFVFSANAQLESQITGVNASHQFITFCLEYNEHIGFGTTYDVSIDSNAILGGQGNAAGIGSGSWTTPFSTTGSNGDALDPRTAYLYSSFLAGTLTSVSGFTYGDNASGLALQDAIWYIENEITTLGPGLARNLVIAAQTANWTDIGNVRVLNLYEGGNNRQSQLVMIPLPAGTTMAGLGLFGLAGIRVVRRRRA